MGIYQPPASLGDRVIDACGIQDRDSGVRVYLTVQATEYNDDLFADTNASGDDGLTPGTYSGV